MAKQDKIKQEIRTHGHLVRTLFVISLIWTIFQMIFIIGVTVWGGKDIPPEFTWVWLTIVGIYAGKKRADRWGDGIKDLRKGEWCVYINWAVTAFLFCWYMLGDNDVILSKEILKSFEGVSAIFFGSEVAKAIDFKRQKAQPELKVP